MANRLMALHELINSLLQVTVVLGDALVNGRINLDHYVDRMQRKKDEKKKRAKLAATAEDGDEKKDESETAVEEEEGEAAAEDESNTTTTHADRSSANNKDGETKADNAEDVLVSTEADETAIINQFMAEASGELDEKAERMTEKKEEEAASVAETDGLDDYTSATSQLSLNEEEEPVAPDMDMASSSESSLNKGDSEAAEISTAVTGGSDEPGDDETSAIDNEVEAVEGKDGRKAADDDDDKGPKRPPADDDD